MDEFWGLSSTAWTGIYTLITFGLLVVAVVAAIYARNQWVEARKASREASRPYVIVATEPSGESQQLFDLVVRNIGVRPAMDVTIKLDPPPRRVEEAPGHEMANMKMLKEPIAMIAPNQELRAFYDSHIDRQGVEDVPSTHRVALSYRDSSGNQYSESSVVDIEAMKGTMHTAVQTTHHIGKTLEKMEKTFRQSSVLHRRGAVQVEASVESRGDRQRRLAPERTESEERDT
ncbi:hypothetical protein LG284_05455 [Citricoccus nitrophenolicus]